MTICKPYDERTAADFRRLFVDRFPDGDPAILETCLANPERRDHPSTGSVAYNEDGSVMAILGLVPRRIYWGQTLLKAANGVAIAVKKDADRAFFPDFIRDAVRENGADLFFVNTAIPPSRKRVKAVLGVEDGPASCSEICERTLRSNGFLARALRKMVAKIRIRSARDSRAQCPPECAREVTSTTGHMTITFEKTISDTDFNAFWESYLKTNSGLVSSRTAEELRWVFGKGLATGEVALITARKDNALQGYAFCRWTDETGMCWRVVDLIALKNDEKILESLIEGASQFLRKQTPALCLQITGYPTWVQPLLRRLFPKNSSFEFNKCIWGALSEKAKALCGDWVNATNGWYGCPYDGDMCLM